MRVLALVTDAFGGHGGIAQYNRDFLTALSRSAAITALPRTGTPSSALPDGLIQLPPAPSKVEWSLQSIRLAMSNRPDVIFCGHMYAAPLAAAIGRALARPVWLQIHGIEAWTSRSDLVRRAVEASSLITSVSRYTRHELLTWCAIEPGRVRVLPNTVSAVQPGSADRDDLIARHALHGRKIILTVGRLSATERYKGHDRIIRCLPRLRQIVPEVVYLIVGSGDDRPRLEALVRETGLTEIVQFAGMVPAESLPDYYALSHVFAMPSTGEGFGIVFLEAAMYGLPVIGGNRDGSVDALADGAIGHAVDPDDSEELTTALADALLKPSPQSAAVQRFAFEAFARHVNDIARRLVPRS